MFTFFRCVFSREVVSSLKSGVCDLIFPLYSVGEVQVCLNLPIKSVKRSSEWRLKIIRDELERIGRDWSEGRNIDFHLMGEKNLVSPVSPTKIRACARLKLPNNLLKNGSSEWCRKAIKDEIELIGRDWVKGIDESVQRIERRVLRAWKDQIKDPFSCVTKMERILEEPCDRYKPES